MILVYDIKYKSSEFSRIMDRLDAIEKEIGNVNTTFKLEYKIDYRILLGENGLFLLEGKVFRDE